MSGGDLTVIACGQSAALVGDAPSLCPRCGLPVDGLSHEMEGAR